MSASSRWTRDIGLLMAKCCIRSMRLRIDKSALFESSNYSTGNRDHVLGHPGTRASGRLGEWVAIFSSSFERDWGSGNRD
jgi:hypothetical protein